LSLKFNYSSKFNSFPCHCHEFQSHNKRKFNFLQSTIINYSSKHLLFVHILGKTATLESPFILFIYYFHQLSFNTELGQPRVPYGDFEVAYSFIIFSTATLKSPFLLYSCLSMRLTFPINSTLLNQAIVCQWIKNTQLMFEVIVDRNLLAFSSTCSNLKI